MEIRPTPKQERFLSSPADIVIFGGSAGGGKTRALLMLPLQFLAVPNVATVIFRRTYPQITISGGLWDESHLIYPFAQGQARQGALAWEWSNGSRVSFRHMETGDAIYNYQGAQIPIIGFDQLEQFTAEQFFFMLARNRSACNVAPRIRATANPQPGWLADFLSWWIAPDGYAHMERSGVMRYFVRINNELIWGDDPAALKKAHGDDMEPKSVTFIPSTVYDNPYLLANNPGYVGNLKALFHIERERLLGDRERGGNWKVIMTAGMIKREWFKVIESRPSDVRFSMRFWDLAASEQAADDKADHDYTVGALVQLLASGQWVISDIRRGRVSPMAIEHLIRQTAVMDGRDVPVRIEEEGGASGKSLIDHYARHVLVGFDFKGVRMGGAKIQRAMPFMAAAESGNVLILKGAWNQALLDELESFSPDCAHDDQVDALSGAFNGISQNLLDPKVGTGNISTQPAISKIDERVADLLRSMTPEERLQAEEILKDA